MIIPALMNMHRLPLVLGSLLMAACGSVVSTGGGGSGDSANTGSTGDPGVVPVDQTFPAVAVTRAQMDILWQDYWSTHDPSGGTSSSSGGGDLDPNDLFLRVSDLGVSCGSPTVDLSCGGHHEMTIVVPPSLQNVGVYDLADPMFVAYSSMTETGEANSADPQDCSWGGGSIGDGTIEILSIDDTSVHFKVTLTGPIWDSDPSGEYTATRCASDQ